MISNSKGKWTWMICRVLGFGFKETKPFWDLFVYILILRLIIPLIHIILIKDHVLFLAFDTFRVYNFLNYYFKFVVLSLLFHVLANNLQILKIFGRLIFLLVICMSTALLQLFLHKIIQQL